ncbi:Ribosome production factor 1 [Elasticomyces elasticus]|nr:Ribosome production factor 1 [Elasticomyces elasticus]
MAGLDPLKIGNKLKRQQQHQKTKKAKESTKRDERFKRRRHEDKNPELREARLAKNVPATIESKRTWDDANADDAAEGRLGLSVDVLHAKRRKVEDEEKQVPEEINPEDHVGDVEDDEEPAAVGSMDVGVNGDEDEQDELDSMLGSDDSDDEAEGHAKQDPPDRDASEAPSAATSAATATTDLNHTPDALIARFPSLFNLDPDISPKVLVTTALNSTLHWEAQLLTSLFPGSAYVRRTAHFRSYKYSVREICSYAVNQAYTHVVILNEDRKKPKGLDIVHLPNGPMFHFSISNWVEGSRLPGHGNPTNHYPELILNGFRTPLGLLAAHLFKSLFPPRPEIQGRQVVTLHNQRDYIFFRRHRYVFRDKRGTEKSIQGTDGKLMKGVEEIRAGLQELGPRFTLKLRRVDKGIQHMSGQEWKWEAGAEKVRTRFSL